MSHPSDKYLGKYVTIYPAYDVAKKTAPMAEGKVLGYLADPSVYIEHADGTRSTWQVTMPMDIQDAPPDLTCRACGAHDHPSGCADDLRENGMRFRDEHADEPTPDLVLATITIRRVLTEDGGDQVWAEFADRDGEMPSLVEVLGMLELTKDTAIRAGMDDDEDEE